MHAKSLFYIYSIGCLCFCTIFTLKFANKIESTDFLNKPIMAEKKGLRDTFYISHGSPRLSIDDSLPARHFLKAFRRTTLSEKPKAILIISGHWETSDPTLNAVVGPMETIYDFYGFPEPMYQLKYPAPGAPDLADKVKRLLHDSGFKRVNIDTKRGLDHGAWVPLMLMYPECDIPVCQLSVQTHKDATHHFNLGKALRGLKDDGVLVIGSGAATHNLRTINRNGGTTVAPWAYEFDKWVKVALEEGRYGDVNEYKEKAPHASLAHPSPDHFYPLHVAMGAAGENTCGEVVHHSWSLETLSYASYRFREKDE